MPLQCPIGSDSLIVVSEVSLLLSSEKRDIVSKLNSRKQRYIFRTISYVLSFAKSHITQTPSDRNSSPDQRTQLLTLTWQTEEMRNLPSKHSE